MTEIAAELFEDRFASDGVGSERAVGIAERARIDVLERAHVGRQSVELRTEARFGLAQRLIARAGLQLFVWNEALAIEGISKLVLEVLDLVEIASPVERTVLGTGAAQKRHRVS